MRIVVMLIPYYFAFAEPDIAKAVFEAGVKYGLVTVPEGRLPEPTLEDALQAIQRLPQSARSRQVGSELFHKFSFLYR